MGVHSIPISRMLPIPANACTCLSSVFWPNLIRLAFIANAVFIAEVVFRVSRGFPIYRQLVTILVFILSGGAHAVGFWAIDPTCDAMSAIWWSILMGLAVAFEDLIRWALSGIRTSRRWRILGYIWVWVYLAWSLPKVLFPNANCF
jgi:hypothetical protein